MAQYFYRENGSRASVITGPFATIDDARLNAAQTGHRVRNVQFMRKEGGNITKIEATDVYHPGLPMRIGA